MAFQDFMNRMFDPGPNVTERGVEQNRAMADALMSQGPGTIQHPLQGLAHLANALNAQAYRQRAIKGESALQQQKAKQVGDLLSNLNLNPQGEALLRSLGPDMQRDVASSLAVQRLSPHPKPASTEVGKINQDVKSGNITPETGEALRQAALNEDRRSIGKAETDLRKEFNDEIRGFASGLQSLDNARNLLALENNPIGAQAALTAFVRAIDNSVVRPSEQAQYQNIFGVAQGLENRIGQLMGQGAFNESSKAEILEAVNALAKAAETYMRGNAQFYGRLATYYGLNPENVVGGMSLNERQAASQPEAENNITGSNAPVLRIP